MPTAYNLYHHPQFHNVPSPAACAQDSLYNCTKKKKEEEREEKARQQKTLPLGPELIHSNTWIWTTV